MQLIHCRDQVLKEKNAAAVEDQHEEDQDIILSPDTMKIRKSRVCTEPNEALSDHFTKALQGYLRVCVCMCVCFGCACACVCACVVCTCMKGSSG